MDFLADNLLALMLAFWAVVVVVGLIVAVVAGLRLWRTLKRTKGRIDGPIATLSASAAEARDRVTGLEAHQRALTDAGDEMSARLAGAAAAGKHAGDVVKTLRFPVRFLAGL